MNQTTLFDLIKAYGQARSDLSAAVDSGATVAEQRAYAEADDLLNAIWRRIRNARDAGFTETGVSIGDILDGKE